MDLDLGLISVLTSNQITTVNIYPRKIGGIFSEFVPVYICFHIFYNSYAKEGKNI